MAARRCKAATNAGAAHADRGATELVQGARPCAVWHGHEGLKVGLLSRIGQLREQVPQACGRAILDARHEPFQHGDPWQQHLALHQSGRPNQKRTLGRSALSHARVYSQRTKRNTSRGL